MDPEATYAPQSPDLSGNYSIPEQPEQVHPQHQRYRGSISHIPPFSPSESHSPHSAQQSFGAGGYNQHNAAQDSPYLNRQPSYMARHGLKHDGDMDEDYLPSPGGHRSATKKFKSEGFGNPANGRLAP